MIIDGSGCFGEGGSSSGEGKGWRGEVWIHMQLSGEVRATRRDGPASEGMDHDAM